jgi:hypothetical protein
MHQNGVDHGMIALDQGRVRTPDAPIDLMSRCAFDELGLDF